ncbi:MAG: heavy metal translocating P-type ATPase [Chloroflexaceae bacterium]
MTTDAATGTTGQTFHIQGMDCAGCARTIEQGVCGLAGVASCELNFTSEKLHITGDVSRETVIARVRALGYEVVEPDTATQSAPTGNFFQFLWQRPTTRLALLGALLILPGIILHELLGIEHWLIDLSALAALLSAGVPIARSAWRALIINCAITINLLMTIAAIGAVIIGAYTEAGMVIVLFALGEALEGYTSSRARDSIRSLMQVVPNTATLLRQAQSPAPSGAMGGIIPLEPTSGAGGTCTGDACTPATPGEQRVSVESLQPGDVILARPGERIPMDGRVIAGDSAVNQAPITGESRLIDKTVGDTLFAGSINGAGALEIEVTHRAEDTTISRLIRMVEEAQEQRAPTQRFIDRFAHYYTPAVVVLALLVAIVPPLFFGQPFWNPDADTFGWFYRALALLVVACPCALVISTPVSLVSAISNAARRGVLVKGGVHLETLSRVRVIAFDKTGTLTAGKPTVIQTRTVACPDGCHSEQPDICSDCDDLLALAHAVEQRSEHPLAQAIVNAAAQRQVQDRYPAASQVAALAGRGVRGIVDGQEVLLGSHQVFEKSIPHPAALCAAAGADAAAGYTPVLVGTNNHYLGTITVADTVRDSSRAAIARLRQTHVQHLVMLTGDTAGTAQHIGDAVGVTEVRAGLLPEEKLQAVHELRQQYGPVAMVGDGINDAPALAAADVSIAIGGQAGGTAQAMETADMTLLRDDLRLLPFALSLSRATMRTIQTNIVLALGAKLVFLVLVLLGMGTLWMAVLADMGASVLVTLYGTRLLGWGERAPAMPRQSGEEIASAQV